MDFGGREGGRDLERGETERDEEEGGEGDSPVMRGEEVGEAERPLQDAGRPLYLLRWPRRHPGKNNRLPGASRGHFPTVSHNIYYGHRYTYT